MIGFVVGMMLLFILVFDVIVVVLCRKSSEFDDKVEEHWGKNSEKIRVLSGEEIEENIDNKEKTQEE